MAEIREKMGLAVVREVEHGQALAGYSELPRCSLLTGVILP